jgi:hypothetical protein
VEILREERRATANSITSGASSSSETAESRTWCWCGCQRGPETALTVASCSWLPNGPKASSRGAMELEHRRKM